MDELTNSQKKNSGKREKVEKRDKIEKGKIKNYF